MSIKVLAPTTSSKKMSRHSFIKTSVARTTSAVGFPMVVPASVLGKDGHIAPRESR